MCMDCRNRFEKEKKIGFFEKLFKKKEDQEIQEEIKEEVTGIVCEACGNDIFGQQKVKTLMNKKYHLQCYRKLRKDAMNTYTGN